MRRASGVQDEWVAVVEANPGDLACESVSRSADGVLLGARREGGHIIEIAAHEHERGVNLTQLVLERPAPLGIRSDMLGVALADVGEVRNII